MKNLGLFLLIAGCATAAIGLSERLRERIGENI